MLHRFNGKDGWNPAAGLIFGAEGNLYGTTQSAGTYNDGVVFELSPNADGKWKEKLLYSFKGSDGSAPNANLIFDGAGNLYSTTVFGGVSGCGSYGCGTAFRLSS